MFLRYALESHDIGKLLGVAGKIFGSFAISLLTAFMANIVADSSPLFWPRPHPLWHLKDQMSDHRILEYILVVLISVPGLLINARIFPRYWLVSWLFCCPVANAPFLLLVYFGLAIMDSFLRGESSIFVLWRGILALFGFLVVQVFVPIAIVWGIEMMTERCQGRRVSRGNSGKH